MILSQYRIFGVVQVAECNSSVIIIADIVCVPMKDVEGQVEPETWYLPLRHTWQYPIVNTNRALLLARSKAEVQHHGTMEPGHDYGGLNRQLLEGDRVFLVVHWLMGPYSQSMRIALNIYANIGYYKPRRL
jgi:hypothetical protein